MKSEIIIQFVPDIFYRISDNELGFYSIKENKLLFGYNINMIVDKKNLRKYLDRFYYYLDYQELAKIDIRIKNIINHLLKNHQDIFTITNKISFGFKYQFTASCNQLLKQNFLYIKEKNRVFTIDFDKKILIYGDEISNVCYFEGQLRSVGCNHIYTKARGIPANIETFDYVIVLGNTDFNNLDSDIKNLINDETIVTHSYFNNDINNLIVGPTYYFVERKQEPEKYQKLSYNQSNSEKLIPLHLINFISGIILSDLSYILTDVIKVLSRDIVTTLNREVYINTITLDAETKSYI